MYQHNTLHIVGKKNSGKSTLIEFLITEMKREGLKIGALKHSSHPHAIDKKGSDSDRFQSAGAFPVAFSTPDGLAVFYKHAEAEDQYTVLNRHFTACDLILIESLRQADRPKVWICSDQPWDEVPDKTIAIVDNSRSHPEIPVFKFNDTKLVRYIIAYYGLDQGKMK